MAWTKQVATDYKDALHRIIDFTTKAFKAGAVTPGDNTGDGVTYGASASQESVAETWTLTCTTLGRDGFPAIFSVFGSESEEQASAVSGEPYSIPEVSFILLKGAVDWAVSDSFTFDVAASTPLWSVNDSDLASAQEWVQLQGVGGSVEGADEIFAGFRTHSNNLTYFNMEVSGFSGYVGANSYDDQPGIRSYYSCMSNVAFDFYIFMTGRSIKVVSVIGTIYEGMYTGWYLPTATIGQYAYPQFVGGSTDDLVQLVGGTEDDHTNYWRGYSRELSGAINDGTSWVEINEFSPLLFGSFSSWQANRAGGRTLYPATLLKTSTDNVYGTLEGVEYIANADSAVTTEDVVTIGTEARVIFQDSFRAGVLNVAAFDLIGDA